MKAKADDVKLKTITISTSGVLRVIFFFVGASVCLIVYNCVTVQLFNVGLVQAMTKV